MAKLSRTEKALIEIGADPSEPVAKWDWLGELSGTKSTFHWLSSILEYSTEQNRLFTRKLNSVWSEESYPASIHKWIEFVEEKYDAGGIYGEGSPFVNNTYNNENAVSDVLLYGYYDIDGTEYVCLSISCGGDPRGGYNRPMIFEVIEEVAIFDVANLGCFCNHCESGWHTDCSGYRWYANNDETELNDLEVVTLDDDAIFPPEKEICAVHPDQLSLGLTDTVVELPLKEIDDPTQIHTQEIDGEVVVFCPHCNHKLGIDFF